MIGHVAWFSLEKRYGFIQPEDAEERPVFVEATALPEGIEGLEPGQRVSFDIESGADGKRAVNVRLAAAVGQQAS